MSDFAVVAAPLDHEDYLVAMQELTILKQQGLSVVQRNIIILDAHPIVIFCLERLNHEQVPTFNLDLRLDLNDTHPSVVEPARRRRTSTATYQAAINPLG